jgi:hypothetical protein
MSESHICGEKQIFQFSTLSTLVQQSEAKININKMMSRISASGIVAKNGKKKEIF